MQQTEVSIDYYKSDFLIEIEGQRKRELNNAIINLSLDENLESPSMLELTLNEELELDTQKFKWLDNKLLSPELGLEIKVYFGYASQAKKFQKPIFTGRITALNPSFASGGNHTLRVQAYDYCHCLQKSKIALDTPIANKNDYSEVALHVAAKNALELGDIDISLIKPCRNITQDPNFNDYDYLKDLAKEIGFEFFIRNRKLYFRRPRDFEKEIFTFEWQNNLISFNPRLSTAKIVKEVTVIGHDPRSPKEPIKATASLGDLDFMAHIPGINCLKTEPIVVKRVPICNEMYAKAIAIATLIRENRGLIEGSFECVGNPKIRPGTNVLIKGIGKRFTGKYYVKGVKHSLEDGKYTMSCEVRRGKLGII